MEGSDTLVEGGWREYCHVCAIVKRLQSSASIKKFKSINNEKNGGKNPNWEDPLPPPPTSPSFPKGKMLLYLLYVLTINPIDCLCRFCFYSSGGQVYRALHSAILEQPPLHVRATPLDNLTPPRSSRQRLQHLTSSKSSTVFCLLKAVRAAKPSESKKTEM